MRSEYYTPAVEEHAAPPLLTTKETSRTAKELGADEEGRIELEIDRKVVISRLSRDVYADYRSGFRELYANAVTACLVARETFKADPSVHITLDPKTRVLEIEERDSVGISPAAFKVYRVVGRSGNFEGTKLGQFGFGKLAWAKISDTVILKTKWRTPDGRTGVYALEGKGATDYFVLPEPKIEHFGTTLKMVLRREVDLHELYKYILRCRFTAVPTILHLKNEITYRGRYDTELLSIASGDRKVTRSFAEDYLARKTKVEKDKAIVRTVKEIKLKADGFEAYLVLAVKKESYESHFRVPYEAKTHPYLLGMPVEADLSLPFTFSVVNVTDERKFSPTADKERLKGEAKEALERALKAAVTRELSFLHTMTIKQYAGLTEDEQLWFREHALSEYFPEAVAHFAKFVEEGFRPYHDNDGEETILKLIEEHGEPNIVFEDGQAFVKMRIERIKKHNPKAVVIKAGEFAAELKRCGFVSCKEYIERHKLGEVRIELAHRVYGSHLSGAGWGGVLSRPARFAEEKDRIGGTVIKVPGSLGKYLPIFSELYTSMKLVKDGPNLARQGISLEDFLKGLGPRKVQTSMGALTVRDLAGMARKTSNGRNGGATPNIVLIPYSDPSVARHIPDVSRILVPADADTLSEIALYFRARKKPYFVSYELNELPDKLLSGYRSDYTGRWNWQYTDPEIILSVAHVARVVKDPLLRKLFDNAAMGSQDASQVAEMRRGVLRLAGTAE